ncbi:MAG: DUF4382 domain-containing protein [Bizionia paragorgiae]|uniref:DUF4382 domain-containing protein n=1 Tax=Bizionia paragorgiae TaxID=283786 RepID=UPI003C52CEFB
MRLLKPIKIFILSLLSIVLFNCSDDDASAVAEGTSNISVRLTDNPGDYDHVYVEVVDVMVKVNDESTGESGWQSAGAINTGVYDLLELTGGINVLLVDGFQVPSGTLNQIRLVLGEDNSIVIDGETFPLNTPSAQQSGLKIKINEELLPGYTYDIVLDFDVDQSIVVAGNSGNINLKPVIHAATQYTSGSIEGAVVPFDYQVVASIDVNGDIISAYTDANGSFVLNGVPEGVYTVTFTPDPASGYATVSVDDVTVVNGEITTLGDVQLAVGTISGTVLNTGVMATVSLEVDGTLYSVETDAEGVFVLEGIPVGVYNVTITPDVASGLSATVIADVEVVLGMTTDLGAVTLS